MKLKKDELKRQGKINTEVGEITEDDMISAFGVTKDHMLKASESWKRRKHQKFGEIFSMTSEELRTSKVW